MVRYGSSKVGIWLIMKASRENSSTKRSETSGLAVDNSVYLCLLSGHPEVRICHPMRMRYYESTDRRFAGSDGEKFFATKMWCPHTFWSA